MICHKLALLKNCNIFFFSNLKKIDFLQLLPLYFIEYKMGFSSVANVNSVSIYSSKFCFSSFVELVL